jgi:hypothetical protein
MKFLNNLVGSLKIKLGDIYLWKNRPANGFIPQLIVEVVVEDGVIISASEGSDLYFLKHYNKITRLNFI